MQRDFNIARGGSGETFHSSITFSYATKLVPNIWTRIAESLKPETMKLNGSKDSIKNKTKNGENEPNLEVVEVV